MSLIDCSPSNLSDSVSFFYLVKLPASNLIVESSHYDVGECSNKNMRFGLDARAAGKQSRDMSDKFIKLFYSR